MANERKAMRVYADFNGIESFSDEDTDQSFLDLTSYGTLANLSFQQIRLHEGMSLTLFDDGIEVEAVAFFDERKIGKTSLSSGWFAKFKRSLIKECTPILHDFDKHVCFKCRRDLKPHLLEVGQQYKEKCPYCETSVMFPLLPPEKG